MNKTLIPLDKLLQPLSAENPCGEDPFNDGSLRHLEVMIQVELDADEAEIEPEWALVQAEALQVMERSKDLRVGVVLCLTLLKLEGLAGFNEGLTLLHGWTENFWESVFPLLDPDDKEDPIRVFVFNNLSASLSTDTPYRFVKYLRQIPLTQPVRLTACNLRDILQARAEKPPNQESDQSSGPTADQIDGSFRDTPLEKLQATASVVQALLETVENLEAAVSAKCAGGSGPNFNLLKQTLAAMQQALAPYLQPPSTVPADAPSAPKEAKVQGTAPSGPPSFAPGGAIHSRGAAEAALRAAYAYFKQYEPSSAVPLLIERALRLSGRSFFESMNELALGSPEDFKKLFGVKPEKENTGSSSDDVKT